jgi:hypothetical protein
MSGDKRSYCYRVKLPTFNEARRILGLPLVGTSPPDADTTRPDAILCGSFGPPCVHCGGVPEALCDFPLGDDGRTCDRSLCLACAPNVGADGRTVPASALLPEASYKNYCHDHDEHGRGMLLFPQPKRTLTPPGPPPRTRAKPLPKAPPESHRWRVRQARDGACLTSWMTEIEARQFARRVGGSIETWDEFVKLWRTLYPLKRPAR